MYSEITIIITNEKVVSLPINYQKKLSKEDKHIDITYKNIFYNSFYIQ